MSKITEFNENENFNKSGAAKVYPNGTNWAQLPKKMPTEKVIGKTFLYVIDAIDYARSASRKANLIIGLLVLVLILETALIVYIK